MFDVCVHILSMLYNIIYIMNEIFYTEISKKKVFFFFKMSKHDGRPTALLSIFSLLDSLGQYWFMHLYTIKKSILTWHDIMIAAALL